mmetsp:Transcript_12551/g.39041  ORF Transcript_12551/g.39041 Transcript_12551/m.39041 type:complete len:213 (-) Transcript_12551:1822-2460(-)
MRAGCHHTIHVAANITALVQRSDNDRASVLVEQFGGPSVAQHRAPHFVCGAIVKAGVSRGAPVHVHRENGDDVGMPLQQDHGLHFFHGRIFVLFRDHWNVLKGNASAIIAGSFKHCAVAAPPNALPKDECRQRVVNSTACVFRSGNVWSGGGVGSKQWGTRWVVDGEFKLYLFLLMASTARHGASQNNQNHPSDAVDHEHVQCGGSYRQLQT